MTAGTLLDVDSEHPPVPLPSFFPFPMMSFPLLLLHTMLRTWCNLNPEEGSSNKTAILTDATKEEIFILIIAVQNDAFVEPALHLNLLIFPCQCLF